MPTREYDYNRLAGLDIARSLAIMSMVFVNFLYVFSYGYIARIELTHMAIHRPSAFGILAATAVLVVLAGFAAPCFLVLFGIGLTLHERVPGLWGFRDQTPPLESYLSL